ncbi:hypothetical protein T484DRAFT_1971187, partial [Baffinella frigidus]
VVCKRCIACRSCHPFDESSLAKWDPASLPPFLLRELFEPVLWQDKTSVLNTRRGVFNPRGGVSSTDEGVHNARWGVSGTPRGGGKTRLEDVDTRGGVHDTHETVHDTPRGDEESRLEDVEITFLSPRFGEVHREPAVLSVRIVGYDFEKEGGHAVLVSGGQQLMAFQGVSNSVVYWETHMPMPPTPGPKSTYNASVIHRAAWKAGEPLPDLGETTRGKEGGGWAAPVERAPEGRRVALVITSCVAVDGRLTLLEETVVSFLESNTHPIERYILIDDSGDPEVHRRLLFLFGNLFDIILNRRRRAGMTFSIDNAYAHVEAVGADFIFHNQDDWLFHTRGDFIHQSIEILLHVPDVMVVWCRDHADHDLPLAFPENTSSSGHDPHGHTSASGHDLPQHTSSGVSYRRLLPMQLWKGFTFNPGLRRVSDYKVASLIQRDIFESLHFSLRF